VRTSGPGPAPDTETPAAVARLIDESWARRGPEDYDGALMGVTGFAKAGGTVTLGCGTMRYRDYVATDRILSESPEFRLPLAVGVHAILLSGEDVIVLRLRNGRLALPGGAVETHDLGEASCGALQHAISREVMEETGIDLAGAGLEITGLYVGGYPTHLIAFFLADVPSDARQAIETFSPVDDHEGIRSVEWMPLSQLVGDMQEASLVVRAATRSLLHHRGAQPAWIIDA